MPVYCRLMPYIKNEQLFDCPSGKYAACNGEYNHHHWVNQARASAWVSPKFVLGFGFSEFVLSYNAPVKESSVSRPAQCVFCADCCGLLNDPNRIAYPNVCSAACNVDRQIPANTRHNGGSNILFLDGHVKFGSAGSIVSGWNQPSGYYADTNQS
jgi:prepilin-type processing-associated H-X9-DG protein